MDSGSAWSANDRKTIYGMIEIIQGGSDSHKCAVYSLTISDRSEIVRHLNGGSLGVLNV